MVVVIIVVVIIIIFIVIVFFSFLVVEFGRAGENGKAKTGEGAARKDEKERKKKQGEDIRAAIRVGGGWRKERRQCPFPWPFAPSFVCEKFHLEWHVTQNWREKSRGTTTTRSPSFLGRTPSFSTSFRFPVVFLFGRSLSLSTVAVIDATVRVQRKASATRDEWQPSSSCDASVFSDGAPTPPPSSFTTPSSHFPFLFLLLRVEKDEEEESKRRKPKTSTPYA